MITIVDDNSTAALNANEKLMAPPVGVFAPSFLTGYIEDQKKSLGFEGDVFGKLSNNQISPDILNCFEVMENDLSNAHPSRC